MTTKTTGSRTSRLYNRLVFWGLLLLSITILTGINNYYFYAHVARENGRNAEKIKIIVKETLSLCRDNRIDMQTCKNHVLGTMEKVSPYYYYMASASLKDFKGNTLWEKPDNKHDRVATLHVEITLPDPEYAGSALVDIENRWSNANVLLSVYRSMTFSLTDLLSRWHEEGIEKAAQHFTTVAWYRSRPAIGFAIFTIILFLLYRKREAAYTAEIAEKERKLVESEKSRQKSQKKLKENDVALLIRKNDKVINPPIDTLKYDRFLELDPESVILKCRKVAEKLIIQIYNKHFKGGDRLTLHDRTRRLSKEKIIDSKIVTQINTIKAFGNLSAHPNVENPIEFSRQDALWVSSALIRLIEEMEKKGLLIEH